MISKQDRGSVFSTNSIYYVLAIFLNDESARFYCEIDDMDRCLYGAMLYPSDVEMISSHISALWVSRRLGKNIILSWPELFEQQYLADDASAGNAAAQETIRKLMLLARRD